MPRNGKQYLPINEEEFPTLGGLLTKKELRNASGASEKATIDRLEQEAADERTAREVAKKERAAKKAARQAANRLSFSTYHHDAIPSSPSLYAPDAAGTEPSTKDAEGDLQDVVAKSADMEPCAVDREDGLHQDNLDVSKTTKAGPSIVYHNEAPQSFSPNSAETGLSITDKDKRVPKDDLAASKTADAEPLMKDRQGKLTLHDALAIKIVEIGSSTAGAKGELPMDNAVATKITDAVPSTADRERISQHHVRLEAINAIKETVHTKEIFDWQRQQEARQHPRRSYHTNKAKAERNATDRADNIAPSIDQYPQEQLLRTSKQEEFSEAPIKPDTFIIPVSRKDHAVPMSLGNPPRPSLQARAQTDQRAVQSDTTARPKRPALLTTQSHLNTGTYDGASDDVRDEPKLENTNSSSTPEQHRAMVRYLGTLVAEEDPSHQVDWLITSPDPFFNRWAPLLPPLRTARDQEAQRAELPKRLWPVLDVNYQGAPVSMFGPHNSPLMPRTWKEFRSGGAWDMTPAYHGQKKVYTNLFQRLAEQQR